MKKILTKDNSITFFNHEFKENLHPESGAIESVYKRYINHLKLRDNIKVLDIGFGIGYISLIILSKVKANITALEKNKDYIEAMKNLKLPYSLKEAYEKLKNINLITGDATKTIKKLNKKFDLIILDAFSPISNKELYSIDFLKELKNRMNKDSVLITYTSNPIVRFNLIESGFKLQKYRISKYEEGTIASLSKENLTEEDKRLIRAFSLPV
ncbi:methyltransferase domain-containing protein [Candidatus Woesearchaeota archaeon]|nr:methyltransferase domain-containing protein [Candidatus Woesearchaeota archaeon]